MEYIIVVDQYDNVIGYKPREQISSTDIYRISTLWVRNSKDQVLLAQRKFSKRIEPGCWGPAVSGTVEKGETYYSNIMKESQEELGLESIKPIRHKKYKPSELGGNYFVQSYLLDIDLEQDEFKTQDSEVEQVRWFNKKDIKNMIKNNTEEFVASAPYWEQAGFL